MEIANDLAAVERRIAAIEDREPRLGAAFEQTVEAASVRVRAATEPHGASRSSIDHIVGANAAAFGVDPALVEAIIANESGFDPYARSSAGARGLMQLMPQTAAALGVDDPDDPAQNVRGGTRYLRSLLDRFGDVRLAVAAYNAGPAAVARYGGIPPFAETERYVRSVLSSYRAATAR